MKIKKNDNIVVLTGKDRGKTGKVVKAFPQDGKVIVEGINLYKKHVKQGQGSASGVVERPMPLQASNVAVVDPKSGKGSRVGYKMVDGKKERILKKSGQTLK